LQMVGITGLVYMELSTEPGETSAPQRVPNEQYPVITGSGTQLAKILEDIPKITEQILEVAEKLNGFFDPKHTALLSKTLENTERLSQDLNGLLTPENIAHASTTIENFSDASADIKEMAARFDQTATEIENAVASLNEVISSNKGNINRFTSEGLNNITETSHEAEKAARAIREVTEKLKSDPSQIIYRPQSGGVEIEK
ncbi:MAG: hypothetical protein KKA05_11010, partial [Alphaproteobacteria bacterium]|nr:hypothetical protein [Alphaproteobacteria bacterium]